ncbi:hypothetical protein [Entomospira culicis]|uniref:Outer membrane lipoprotein-sorting protein n=1 Tax=Entomospira culicis TaxID=2719989 RepID=A0A968GH16_9SPIO|nr:hypothetical protein [Entomospira culicis]NIZ18682.1 hypothetical protein [Entomospira culicis]NIZ68897.1 hypothetical protein [Entomospira culicis]WDI37490.1 hypothetical protein PVA46_01495 [Entomospira culicis]WDI39118.1 hypothetical protein PVA47_01500 [Entomospira culicis]
MNKIVQLLALTVLVSTPLTAQVELKVNEAKQNAYTLFTDKDAIHGKSIHRIMSATVTEHIGKGKTRQSFRTDIDVAMIRTKKSTLYQIKFSSENPALRGDVDGLILLIDDKSTTLDTKYYEHRTYTQEKQTYTRYISTFLVDKKVIESMLVARNNIRFTPVSSSLPNNQATTVVNGAENLRNFKDSLRLIISNDVIKDVRGEPFTL